MTHAIIAFSLVMKIIQPGLLKEVSSFSKTFQVYFITPVFCASTECVCCRCSVVGEFDCGSRLSKSIFTKHSS